ncbi:hypothetical protein LY90DRAFT_674839, partial [Neocallimastix californiae]
MTSRNDNTNANNENSVAKIILNHENNTAHHQNENYILQQQSNSREHNNLIQGPYISNDSLDLGEKVLSTNIGYISSSNNSPTMNTNISNYSSKSNEINNSDEQIQLYDYIDITNKYLSLSNSPVFESPNESNNNNPQNFVDQINNENVNNEQFAIGLSSNNSEITNISSKISIATDDIKINENNEKLNNSLNFDSNSINNRNSKRDTINNLKQSHHSSKINNNASPSQEENTDESSLNLLQSDTNRKQKSYSINIKDLSYNKTHKRYSADVENSDERLNHSYNIGEYEHRFRFDAAFAETLKKTKLLLRKTPQPQSKTILTTKEYIDEMIENNDEDELNINLNYNKVFNNNLDENDVEYSVSSKKKKRISSSLDQFIHPLIKSHSNINVNHISNISINSSPNDDHFGKSFYKYDKYYSSNNFRRQYGSSSRSSSTEDSSYNTSTNTSTSTYTSSSNDGDDNKYSSSSLKHKNKSLSRSTSSSTNSYCENNSENKRQNIRKILKLSRNSILKDKHKNKYTSMLTKSLDKFVKDRSQNSFNSSTKLGKKNNNKLKSSQSFSDLISKSSNKKKFNEKRKSYEDYGNNKGSNPNLKKSILQIFEHKKEKSEENVSGYYSSDNDSLRNIKNSKPLVNEVEPMLDKNNERYKVLHSSLIQTPMENDKEHQLIKAKLNYLSAISINSEEKQRSLKSSNKIKSSLNYQSIRKKNHKRHKQHVHKRVRKTPYNLKENEVLLKGGLQYNDEGQLISSFGMPLRRQTVAALTAFLYGSPRKSNKVDNKLETSKNRIGLSSNNLFKDITALNQPVSMDENLDICKSNIISKNDELFQANDNKDKVIPAIYPQNPNFAPTAPQIPISVSLVGIKEKDRSFNSNKQYSSLDRNIKKESQPVEEKIGSEIKPHHRKHKHKKRRRKRRREQFVPLSMIEKSNIKDKINMQINPLVNIKNVACLGRINTDNNSLDPFFGIILFSMGDTTFRNFSFFKYGVYALLLVLFIRTIVQGSTLFSAVQVMIIPFIIAIMTIHTSKKRELSFKRNFLDFKIVQLEKNNLRLRNLHQNKLLLLSLPETIVSRLQSGMGDFNSLSCRVEDANCKGLLNILSAAPPDVLPMVLAILNEYFVCLDVLIENYSSNGCLTKIKTIGTKYLLAGNVLKHSDNHLYDMACIALHILKTFDPDVFFQEVDYRKEKTKLELKMGIAVGPLVTGICGSKKFLWDIWGDTCNMASRMQTTLIGSGIQITEAVYERLKNDFTFSDKMSTNIKGKGKTTTYLLLDYKSENTQDKKKKSITQ